MAPDKKNIETSAEQDFNLHLEERIDNSRCGFWIFHFEFFQRLASKKIYILLFGLVGCINISCYGYYNATLTTIEKRFKIPSKNFGIISSGYEISAILTSVFLCYYASKKHIPRCMAIAELLLSVTCFMYGSVYLIYGPGQDSTVLTYEYGSQYDNKTIFELVEAKKKESLCFSNKTNEMCNVSDKNSMFGPQLIYFLTNIIAAVGGTLFGTLGITYLDDNVRKEKSPFLISLTSFLRMLGPPMGFALASYCLRFYVTPDWHPTIPNSDPRWIGAWWMGWFALSGATFFGAVLFAFFPKMLPRAAKRKLILLENNKKPQDKVLSVAKPSFQDYKATAIRLFKNKVLMFNNAAGVFYTFGYLPFFTFQAKYIEIQYKVSASTASLVTGSVSMGFAALGLLVSGAVISKCKPSGRTLAAWNIFSSILSVSGIIAYSYFGCDASKNTVIVQNSVDMLACNSDCNCDFVKYSPICGSNDQTYISACHAGCKEETTFFNGTKLFENCSCIINSFSIRSNYSSDAQKNSFGSAVSGVCPVNCTTPLILFLIIVCINKFIGGTEGTVNFLLGMRCIDASDKIISLSISYVFIGLFALIPSPILFGTLIDNACVLWGKTCAKTGNCWLYNEEELRYTMNLTAAGFVMIGTLLDIGTWYYAKNVKVFDDVVEKDELKNHNESDNLKKQLKNYS